MARASFVVGSLVLAACGGGGRSTLADHDRGVVGSTGAVGAAGAPSRRPDPGPPPEAASGFVVVSHMRRSDGLMHDQFAGYFQTPAKALASADVKGFLARWAEVAIDTCISTPPPPTPPMEKPMYLDAGTLTLVAPDGADTPVPKTALGGVVVYDGQLAGKTFVSGGKYGISGGGGDFTGFSGELWAPTDFELVLPVAAAGLVVARSAPLELRWKSDVDGDDVFVFLVQQGKTHVVCRLTDDGAFTVPTSALAHLAPTAGAGAGTYPDQVIVEKYTWSSVPAGSANVLTEFLSGATLGVTYE